VAGAVRDKHARSFGARPAHCPNGLDQARSSGPSARTKRSGQMARVAPPDFSCCLSHPRNLGYCAEKFSAAVPISLARLLLGASASPHRGSYGANISSLAARVLCGRRASAHIPCYVQKKPFGVVPKRASPSSSHRLGATKNMAVPPLRAFWLDGPESGKIKAAIGVGMRGTLLRRPRYQHGFFSRHQRKKGPAVWVYRWREIDAKGERKMRTLVVGSVKQYPTETAAWKAVSTLRLDINHHTSRPEGLPETFEQLVQHYRMIELDLEKASERKGHQTKQVYEICCSFSRCSRTERTAVGTVSATMPPIY
jgi:hypothetical protein